MTIEEAIEEAQQDAEWRMLHRLPSVRTTIFDLCFPAWATAWAALSWHDAITDPSGWNLAAAIGYTALGLGLIAFEGVKSRRRAEGLTREVLRAAAQIAITAYRRQHGHSWPPAEVWRYDGQRWRVSTEVDRGD